MALRQTYLSMKSRLPAETEAVLVMRGRGNDELAPADELFREFNDFKKEFAPGSGYASDIHYAWAKSDYERRFRAQIKKNPAALARLKELADRARTRDVFLICYEGNDKPCHRRLLLDIAASEFGAVVDATPFGPDEVKRQERRVKGPPHA